ncbi:uncharacterized protein LOC119406775 [Rhipicephalus sanguineus]|uniref:Uncharacterized protein n=1 Tax=Rhipicephalus sanguineus TaxID=34632 RepID=A0A9D4QET1_RHISA|nr:uncharacterized protein LOC119406775 [Rhipicephalus sanguineus]KAH7976308.1 hypothetical protein HPB52_011427 [Rhipicephalus sanguineus]
MNFRKCVQKLGAHLSCSKPRHGGLRIKTGKDVAVSNENLDAARKYVDVVMQRLRRDIVMQGVGMADLRSPNDDCSAWELHSGTISGLERISHDSRPWPLKTPSNDVDDVGSPERYDVAAVVLLHDVCFEALYDYTSHTLAVSGKVSGKIAIVRLDMIIGREPQGPDGAPEVILFEVTEYTRVGISKQSVGVLNEKIINEVTEKVVHTCIEDAMSYRVLPVLNSALKVIPYPNFT